MDQIVIDDVKKTIPLLEEHGVEITGTFYSKLFSDFPQMKNVFNMTHQETGHQKTALANSVLAYAKNIDKLENLTEAVSLIAHKHVAVGVKPEHYPIVGRLLLESIKEVLSLNDDHCALKAWRTAYQALAEVFISTEAGLREVNQQEEDFVEYSVSKIEEESTSIKSFYFTANKIPSFKPGQYISVAKKVGDYNVIRQYTISTSPNNECLRVSVKKDQTLSSVLHNNVKVGDKLMLSRPAGDFLLKTDSKKDKVFVSAGIGITPFISMMEVSAKSGLNYSHIHCDKDYDAAPFKKLLVDSKSTLFLEDTTDRESAIQGYFDISKLDLNDIENKEFYICGPTAFMKSVVNSLREVNVADSDINYEFFGSATESF